MAATRRYRFGPGYLESVELRVWTVPDRARVGGAVRNGPRHLAARVTGTVDLARPVGLERTAVEARTEAWTTESSSLADLLAGARYGDGEALACAERLAEMLVEWSIEEGEG